MKRFNSFFVGKSDAVFLQDRIELNRIITFYKQVCGYIVVIFGVLLMSGCGKTVEFTEEVEVPGVAGKILVKRKEIFEPRITGLDMRQSYIGSELEILDTKIPAWRSDIHPLYLGQSPEGRFYLIAIIWSSITCVQRGRPSSPYVMFIEKGSKWEEISLPKEVDGLDANLLITINPDRRISGFLSLDEKIKRNKVAAVFPRDKKIILSSTFGC